MMCKRCLKLTMKTDTSGFSCCVACGWFSGRPVRKVDIDDLTKKRYTLGRRSVGKWV